MIIRAVISPCAAGSLQLNVKPGDFVVCDQFVDRTSGRIDTFYDGPIVTHLSSADVYDPILRGLAGLRPCPHYSQRQTKGKGGNISRLNHGH